MSRPKKITTDVVVVGSGPGGATVARDLTLQGKNVVIVEWGKDNKPTGSLDYFMKATGWMLPKRGMLVTSDFLMMIRAITVGGTTMFYTGCSWDPPYDEFKKYGVDLSPEVTEGLKKELNVKPLPDDKMGVGATAIMKSALDLGYDWRKIDKFIDPSKGDLTCKDVFWGCKNGAKWDARQWVKDAVAKGATLMPGTLCHDIILENGKATGIKAINGKGQAFEIKANAVVISAGGVGSPMILQNAGIYEAGRNFFFDPFELTYGYINAKTAPNADIPMVAGMHIDDQIMVTDMTNPAMMTMGFSALSMRPANKYLKRKGMVTLMTKVKDSMDGTVDVNGRVAKQLTHEDRHLLSKGKAISTRILKNLGAKDIWYGGLGAAHPGGTCRIGAVVDKNLQTEYDNLYVSDASVIPDQFGKPPVLTILSLSRRLASHLVDKV